MLFKRIAPTPLLEPFIECYWIVESDDPPSIQKIIPDGFPEIIFHYGDPYQININAKWELQANALLAGQITKYFFLQNTGSAGIFGIKLKPHAVTHLFDFDMKSIVDKVIPMPNHILNSLLAITGATTNKSSHGALVSTCESTFCEMINNRPGTNSVIDSALKQIFERRGMVTVQELGEQCHVSERQLERLFGKYIGLSPKFYARIVRFSYVFEVMQEKSPNWSDVVHKAGFYDQSHFIKNFKAFTGEDPSSYLFDDPNFANFFMNKVTS